MSQTVSGEGGGGGVIPNSSNKFLQHPIESPHGTNYSSPGQRGVLYTNAYIPSSSIKSDNPQVESGFHSPASLQQFNIQSSQMNSQYHTMQQHPDALKGRSEVNSSTYSTQSNPCANVQYFPGGNYVTTVTVNQGEHYQNNVPVQYMQNPQNYYMSTGAAMVSPGNNIKYFQNMMLQENKINNPCYNSQANIGLASETRPMANLVSEHSGTPEDNNVDLVAANKNERKVLDPNINAKKNVSKATRNNRKNNSNRSRPTSTSSEVVCESRVSEKVNNNCVIKITSNTNSATNLRTSSSISSVNNSNCIGLNRPRTNSRCDSVRSETTESSCSSLSSESLPDQTHLNHHSQLAFSTGMKNNNHFGNNHYLNNQVQTINNFNNNMNYQNYMACQARMNQGISKPGMYNNNSNVIQTFQQVNAFQHVQMQSGQVQLMQQQQYPCIQGQNLIRPSVGMPPGNISQPGSVMQSQDIQNVDHNIILGQNSSVISNCNSHNSATPQKLCGSQTHGHFSVMHNPISQQSFPQQRILLNSGMMGISPDMPVSVLNKPFAGIVVVPFGWKRLVQNEQVVYVSPSGSELKSSAEVCEYLTQENTCKCGLQCPLRVENVFCFDPKVPHRLTMPDELSSGEATKMCNHRRKLAVAFSHHLLNQAKKEDGRKKRKRKSDSIDDVSPTFSPHSATYPETPNQISDDLQQQNQKSDFNLNESQEFQNQEGSLPRHSPSMQDHHPETQLLQTSPEKQTDEQSSLQTRYASSIQERHNHIQSSGGLPKQFNGQDNLGHTQYQVIQSHTEELSKSVCGQRQTGTKNDDTLLYSGNLRKQPTSSYCRGGFNTTDQLEESQVSSSPQKEVESRCLPKSIIVSPIPTKDDQLSHTQLKEDLNKQGSSESGELTPEEISFSSPDVQTVSEKQLKGGQNEIISMPLRPPETLQYGHVIVSQSGVMQESQLNQNEVQQCSSPSQTFENTRVTNSSALNSLQLKLCQSQPHARHQFKSQLQQECGVQQTPIQQQALMQNSMFVHHHHQSSPAVHSQSHGPQLQLQLATNSNMQIEQGHVQHSITSEGREEQCHISNSDDQFQHQDSSAHLPQMPKAQQRQHHIQIIQNEVQNSPQSFQPDVQLQSPNSQIIVQQQQSQGSHSVLPQAHMHLQHQAQHSQIRQQDYDQSNSNINMAQFQQQQMHRQLNTIQTQMQQQQNTCQTQIVQNCNPSQPPQHQGLMQPNIPQSQEHQHSNIHHLQVQHHPNSLQSPVQVHQQANTPQPMMMQQSSAPQTPVQGNITPQPHPIHSHSGTPHLQIHQSQPGSPHLQMQNLANPHQSQPQIQNNSNPSQMQHQSTTIQSNVIHQPSVPPQIQQQNISQVQMLSNNNINHNQVGLQHHPMQQTMQQLQMSQPQLPVQAQIQGYGQAQQPHFVKQQNAHTQMQLPLCTMQVQGTQNQTPQTSMQHVGHLQQSPVPQQMPNHQFQMQQQQFQIQHSNQQQFQHMQVASQNRHPQGQLSYHQSQVQMSHMQQMAPMQQHQQSIYQPNQNQNWHPVYGNSRLLVSNSGCQGNVDGFVTQSQSCGAGAQFPCQYPQGCENHNNPCFPASQTPKVMHPGIRPLPFANMNRPAFCRAPGEAVFRGMIPPQGGCLSPGQMQMQLPHPMMGGMRPGHPFMNNNNNNMLCRMPVHANHMHMYGNGNQINSHCPENNPSISDPISVPRMSVPEEGEKRRKGGGGRSRKKVKMVLERNSPCPNVDVRNLITEISISPHTGPGPPFSSTTQPSSLSSDAMVTSSCNASNKFTSQGQPVSGPSFMEDPNGYLAQQTALLNSTMSGGAVGQFSPQPRPTCPSAQSSSIAPTNVKTFSTRTIASGNTKVSLTSSSVMPLPSNVPLPARVSKASMSTSGGSGVTLVSTGSTACNTVCSSVQSKTDLSTCSTSTSPSPFRNQNCPLSEESHDSLVATAEPSSLSQTVTVTYTSSSVTTTTCGIESNSPQSSQDAAQVHLESKTDYCHDVDAAECQGSESLRNKIICSTESPTCKTTGMSKLKNESLKKPSEKLNVSECINSKKSSGSGLSVEAANKPLTPGPAESTMNTQSPLEMVQNIVSSIPMPLSDEIPSLPGRHFPNSQSSQVITDQGHSLHQSLAHHQVLGPQVYNMTNSTGMTGVMYNPNGPPPGMLRGTGSLVVHGGASTGTIPPGVIVSNSGNMVVVTSPFNSKVSCAAPVVCTNVTGINSMVGMQAVPQVQMQNMQSSMVNSHHLQSHLQPIQPVQPVVQLVNTYATMQTPVLIQNGSNLIQSPSGVISSHGGVLGPASIIPNSAPTFVTSQPLLTVDSSSHASQVQMTQVVTSASGESNDENCSNRLTPIATSASTPSTPLSTPGSSQGSESSPHGSAGGSGRKRKRRRNTSTPQRSHHSTQQSSHPPNIMPAIIMGKQIPHHMVMNGAQISHYGNVTVGSNNGPPSATTSHMLTATGQPTNSINVVQMVGGHMSGPMPVHLQQPPAIIVPSAAPGLIINQLPDGTFVSTDPSSGVTYPVQLQLSGSHIVGVTPLQNANAAHNIVGSISGPSVTRGTMVAVRQQTSQPNSMMNTGAKLLNISPSITPSQGEALVHNVYGVSASTPVSQSIVCTSANLCSTFPANLSPHQHPNQTTAAAQQPLLVGNGNGTLLQQKTTTIVAQQTTVLATQGGMMGTHSTVSTQTSGVLGESDVSSSDCIANTSTLIEMPISPSHQSAEVTTTRHDEDSASTPESVILTPPPGHSPEAAAKKVVLSVARTASRSVISSNQEPHSASTTDDGFLIEKDSVVWGAHHGHQFWPAQVIHKVGGEAAVRWFGDYQVEMMPLTSISKCPPNSVRKTPTRRSNRGRTALDKAIAEALELKYRDCFAKSSSMFCDVYSPEDVTAPMPFKEPILASSKQPGSIRTKKKKKSR